MQLPEELNDEHRQEYSAMSDTYESVGKYSIYTGLGTLAFTGVGLVAEKIGSTAEVVLLSIGIGTTIAGSVSSFASHCFRRQGR